MKTFVLASVALIGLLAGSGCAAGSSAPDDSSVDAQVVEVIDGDTIRVEYAGERHSVRLLNIDTPETKHPDRDVECLGPEASDYLNELLAPGDSVRLEFDEERTDRYDRILAGVFKDDDLINAAIARAGFGIAAYFEPNDRFLPPVQEAQAEAESAGRGLFNDSLPCTVPSQVQEAVEEVDELGTELPEEYEALEESAASAAAAVLLAEETRDLILSLDPDEPGIHHRAYGSLLGPFERRLDRAITTAEERVSETQGEIQEIDEAREAEREAAERQESAREEAERQKAEDQAAEERERNRQPAPQPAPAPAPAPQPTQQPAPAPAPVPQPTQQPAPAPAPVPQPTQQPAPAPAPNNGSSGGGGGTPNLGPSDRPAGYTHRNEPTNYTGPRCFLPGGNWWKPC